jgi:hypothetical protein
MRLMSRICEYRMRASHQRECVLIQPSKSAAIIQINRLGFGAMRITGPDRRDGDVTARRGAVARPHGSVVGLERRSRVESVKPQLQENNERFVEYAYFFTSASRSKISLSSSALCWAIRSAALSSFSLPAAPAACSTSCRMLSRRIAIRSSSSGSDSTLFMKMLQGFVADRCSLARVLPAFHGNECESASNFAPHPDFAASRCCICRIKDS